MPSWAYPVPYPGASLTLPFARRGAELSVAAPNVVTVQPSRPSSQPSSQPTVGSPTGVAAARWADQRAFDELGRPLRDVTFCVVDLETTGGNAASGARITEVGAVKVRAGEILGEFQTLVDPGEPIPAFIAVLTGITDALVAGAPRIDAVLPSFLEFASGAVLVAHNAPFDVGFLRHECQRLGRPWPTFDVVDTATLARRVIRRDEAPNCKLGSLATLFRASTTPDHRALSDARATVDVLHGLIGRLGALGVQTLEELSTYTSKVSAAQRRKRHLAEHLPHAPGVYVFWGPSDEALYVGTSKDLRTRVRRYFTASETRSRMGEMVGLAAHVEAIECATALEAQVRELRLIAAHKPRYNRRSRHPERASWIKLTREPWPRLSLVRTAADDATYLGPFSGRRGADAALTALHETFPVRQCTARLPIHPNSAPCALAELGRCLSPCDGSVDTVGYDDMVERLRAALGADPRDVIAALTLRIERLAEQERFEEAAAVRDRLTAYVRASARAERIRAIAGCAQIVAALPGATGWEVHVIRHGRLAAAGAVPADAEPTAWVDRLVQRADTVVRQPGPLPASTAEEVELLARWLEGEGVRLISMDGEWSCSLPGAARFLGPLSDAEDSKATLIPFDELAPRMRQRPSGLRDVPARVTGLTPHRAMP